MSDVQLPALAASARLFGRLLLRELDEATLGELQPTSVRESLAALGIDVPDLADLDELAHAWLTCFLHTSMGTPPVQSLVQDSSYDGDAAAAVRTIADAAGLELAPGARNAPPDHLGSILWLWAEVCDSRPELAAMLAARHMCWAEQALQPTARRDDVAFYPAVARATIALLGEIRDFPLRLRHSDFRP